MRSEMRRSAHALVERRVERFESLHPPAQSRERLAGALARLGPARAVDFSGSWSTVDGREVYEAAFAPPARVRWYLQSSSIVLVLLMAASAWLLYAGAPGALRFLVPLFTALSIFAFPLVVTMLGSQREAEESRIVRAIAHALRDAPEKFPPPQKWADED